MPGEEPSVARRERAELIIGEALVDVVYRDGSTIEELPGGSPANVALALGRLGADVDLLTQLGDDRHGGIVADWLHDGGVTLLSGGVPDAVTPVARAHIAADGSATYDFELDWRIDAGGVDVDRYGVVHTGSIGAVLSPGAESVARLVHRAAATATITYDPNARPAVMGEVAPTRAKVERMVALADVVKVSDEDLAWLYPDRNATDVVGKWYGLGPAIVVLTRGAAGATARCAAGTIDVPAPRVEIVDTVGAGDTFMAGLVDGIGALELVGADRRDALRDIDVPALTGVLQQAGRAAAITVSRPGADPPTRAELGVSPRQGPG